MAAAVRSEGRGARETGAGTRASRQILSAATGYTESTRDPRWAQKRWYTGGTEADRAGTMHVQREKAELEGGE